MQKLSLFTPVKAIKGESPEITKRRKWQETCFQRQFLKSDNPLNNCSTG